MRKIFTPHQKAQVAIEAVKEIKTINQIASDHAAHPTQVGMWKKQLIANAHAVFADKRNPENREKDELIERLYTIIGQRDIELDWLKKNCTLKHSERVAAIDRTHPDLNIARQAQLVGISRGSVYYTPVVNEEDIRIMNAIDELFTKRPIHGTRKLRRYLRNDYGMRVGRDHIARLLGEMGLEPVYPKPRIHTSISHPKHKKYPYLLRNVPIVRPNQVWSTDITYVRLEQGWAYLVAILDWFSRYVLAWELSLSLETEFCIAALERALAIAKPEIHNSDQGSQFTDRAYTGILEGREIAISMDGRGRCFDNIFIERLWRTVKYEDIFLRSYHAIRDAHPGLGDYFAFYNTERPHQSLGYRTPAEVYFNSQ